MIFSEDKTQILTTDIKFTEVIVKPEIASAMAANICNTMRNVSQKANEMKKIILQNNYMKLYLGFSFF